MTDTLISETASEQTKTESDSTSKTLIAESKEPTDESASEVAKQAENKKEIEYTDWKLPEGYTLHETINTEFKGIAKELGLTQEQAQKLVDIQARVASEEAKRQDSIYDQEALEWKKESEKAFGSSLKSEIAYAVKAFKTFDPTGSVLKFIDETRVGNRKDFIEFFSKIGKALSEDTLNEGKQRVVKKTDAEIFYPNMK